MVRPRALLRPLIGVLAATGLCSLPAIGQTVQDLATGAEATNDIRVVGPTHTIRPSHLAKEIRPYETESNKAYSQALSDNVVHDVLKPLFLRANADHGFHYGALNFYRLFQKFHDVRFFPSADGTTVQATPERKTDLYLAGQFVVFINPGDYDKANDAGQTGILLHTMLGASGYNDENYQISLAITMANICFMPEIKFPAPLENFCHEIDFPKLFPTDPEQLINKTALRADPNPPWSAEEFADGRFQVAGGFTGVGGGGDFRSVILKLGMLGWVTEVGRDATLPADCRGAWPDDTAVFADILNAKVEVSETIQTVQSFSAQNFEFPEKLMGNSKDEGLAIKEMMTLMCQARLAK